MGRGVGAEARTWWVRDGVWLCVGKSRKNVLVVGEGKVGHGACYGDGNSYHTLPLVSLCLGGKRFQRVTRNILEPVTLKEKGMLVDGGLFKRNDGRLKNKEGLSNEGLSKENDTLN